MATSSEPLLTPRQAYLAMYEFLRQYYLRGLSTSHEIGGLLTGLSLLSDGTPADNAYAYDWNDAVSAVLAAELTPEGYREADFRLVKPDAEPSDGAESR